MEQWDSFHYIYNITVELLHGQKCLVVQFLIHDYVLVPHYFMLFILVVLVSLCVLNFNKKL